MSKHSEERLNDAWARLSAVALWNATSHDVYKEDIECFAHAITELIQLRADLEQAKLCEACDNRRDGRCTSLYDPGEGEKDCFNRLDLRTALAEAQNTITQMREMLKDALELGLIAHAPGCSGGIRTSTRASDGEYPYPCKCGYVEWLEKVKDNS